MDAIFEFTHNFLKTKYDDLSTKAVQAAKNEILDSLATAIGGCSAAGIVQLVDLIKEWGGAEQSTIIAYGIKCPAPNAAQVNGAMIHALDYDDGNPAAMVHVGCVTVATCLAIGERAGKISGKEMITAIALGADLMARLSLSSRPGSNILMSGWHPTALYGYFGAAGIAGRLLGLDNEKMANAFGIAYHQCAGNMQCIKDGAMTKRMGPGLAAKGGITAALMAERGITGANNCLEGDAGLFNVYHAGDYDRSILTADLGKKYEVENLGFKPYPCCGHTHAHIDATLSLKSKYDIEPDQVDKITAFCGDAAYTLCEPLQAKRSPRNIVDAQFSVPWAIATAIVKGKVTLEDFTDVAIKNKKVLKLSQVVIGRRDESLTRHGVGPGRVTVAMKSGTQYTEDVEFCLGTVERPMTFNDCARKFEECSANSRKPLSNPTIEEMIESISGLEKLDNALDILRLID